MVLTNDQDRIFNDLKSYVFNSLNCNYYLVQGVAGTGKSTLINHFIEWYVSEVKSNSGVDNIVVTAPTNKAVRVLRKMNKQKGVDYKTLHSLLGLKPKINEKGEEVFVQDKKHQPTLFSYKVVIVDESSMIDDAIFDLLINQAQHHKIIFVGDAVQIPPVNHAHSKPMMDDVQQELDIRPSALTDIVRQAKDNPIISVSTEIREGTFKFEAGKEMLHGGTGVRTLGKDSNDLMRLLKEKFLSSEYADDPDFAKVVAWRNKTVNTFNNVIRQFIYYKGVNKIVKGEKLTLNRPHVDRNGHVQLFSNEDLVVVKVDTNVDVFSGIDIKYYSIMVRRSDESNGELCELRIVHEDSEGAFEDAKQAMVRKAKRAKGGGKMKMWVEYYSFMEQFADFAYSYAVTAHKSQGSTYDNCFVCFKDIMYNRNPLERQRILYTAATRPRHNLYIF